MLFLESPWPILTLGLVVELLLAIALFQTRKGKLLWAMGGVALLVLVGVLIEHNTITDKKLVRQTLEAAAAGLVANKAERVTACIVPGPDGDRTREQSNYVLRQGEFHEVSISNLEVELNYRTSPYTAEAKFTAFLRGSLRHGEIDGELSRPYPVEVKLRKESGRWLVYGEVKYDGHE
jgi:hypothetical protein